MHKLPLLNLNSRTIDWDRESRPDFELIQQSFNNANMKEMDSFLAATKQAYCNFKQQSYIAAAENLKLADNLYADPSNESQVVKLLNMVILRAPTGSIELEQALQKQGNLALKNLKFQTATLCFELLVSIGCRISNVDICKSSGDLVISLYMNRFYERAKYYLSMYKRCKAKISAEDFERSLRGADRVIAKFEDELLNLQPNHNPFCVTFNVEAPFKDFGNCEKFPSLSSACNYISDSKSEGVYSDDVIPVGSVVFTERPLFLHSRLPYSQCEVCFRTSEQLISCLDCRYKTYCSLSCMYDDKKFHEEECTGYKNLMLISYDATILFAILKSVSFLLQMHVFGRINSRIYETSAFFEQLANILNNIIVNSSDMIYFNFIKEKPNYSNLSDLQYSTLVSTAFRLTMFVEKECPTIMSAFNKYKTSSNNKRILIATLVMRIQYHIFRNTFEITTDNVSNMVPEKKFVQRNYNINCGQVGYLNEKFVKDIRDFCGKNIDNNNIFQIASVVLSSHNIRDVKHVQFDSDELETRTLFTFHQNVLHYMLYSDGLSNLKDKNTQSLISLQIWKLSIPQRLKFIQIFGEIFHMCYADYFLKYNASNERRSVVIYTENLGKLRHSCDPNIEIVCTKDNVILGKVRKPLVEGEELTISKGVNFIQHSREDRIRFLQSLNKTCDCNQCIAESPCEPTDLIQAINCEICQHVITPSQIKCLKCSSS